MFTSNLIKSIPDKSTSRAAKKKAALQKLSPSWLPRVYSMICILFRMIETNSTSVDESVSTSLVNMHIPYEIFAISSWSNRTVHRGAISRDQNNRFASRNERGRSLAILTFDVPRSHGWESGKSVLYNSCWKVNIKVTRIILFKNYLTNFSSKLKTS